MRPAEVRYAPCDGGRIAYSVVGQGSLDLVLVPGLLSNLDILPEDPGYWHLVKRLSTFGRLVLFDRPGTGLSDRLDPAALRGQAPPVDDIAAVIDATGCGRVALLGESGGACAALRFAADHPERVRSLVLFGGYARFRDTVMDARKSHAFVEAVEASWGSGVTLATLVPSRTDARDTIWWARLERLSASPTAAAALLRREMAIDVRDRLGGVQAPTLVIHRTGDAYASVRGARHLAREIPGARLAELPGHDHPVWTGDVDRVADLVEEFLTGARPVANRNRVLAIVLVAQLGDPSPASANAAQRQLLGDRIERFLEAAPAVAERHGGHADLVGRERIVARFDSPTRAVGAAIALRETASSLGLDIAQGIHVGEVDVSLSPAGGIALDIAMRIAAAARPPDILLSRLARELVSGSGLQFAERQMLALDGAVAPLALVALTTERHLEPVQRKARAASLQSLSSREREVLALIADGLSNTHIAMHLGLSEHTAKRHVANILLKLDLPSRVAAAALVARQGAD